MTSLLAAARSGGAATASGRCGSTAARTGVVPRATLGAGASLHTAAAKVVPVSALGVVGGSSSSGPALSLVGAAAAGGVVLPASSMSGGSVATSAAAAAVSAQTAVLARATAATNAVVELDAESFYSYLDANSQSLVVVDFFTDWCGPCQLMHKELDKMTPAFKKVRFAKLNCGKGDQQFATRQRIRSLPTFRVYHRGACLDEVTGAKPVQLRQLLTHYSCLISM